MTFGIGLASVYFFHNLKFTDREELKNATIIKIAELPKFTETFRACGTGYVQGYVSNNGTKLSEGNLGCKEPKKNNKRIVNRDSERIISELETEGQVHYEIYQIEKGRCINSPTIELGLELEEFLKNK